jgi:hypothetical protein
MLRNPGCIPQGRQDMLGYSVERDPEGVLKEDSITVQVVFLITGCCIQRTFYSP